MASPDEIQRIAAAMNAHRPDWPVRSLVTFLERHHAGRPYRDLAIAATTVATDPKTQTPQLLNEHGAWWQAAQAAAGQSSQTAVPRHDAPRCTKYGHDGELAHNCRACRSEALAAPDDYDPQAIVTITPEQAAANARGAAMIRATLTTTRELAAGDRTREDAR